MYQHSLIVMALATACAPTSSDDSNNSDDTSAGDALGADVLADGLENVFEMVSAPDGDLWVTERTAGRVTRVSVADGTKTTLLTDLPDFLTTEGTQDGLLGMALHPDLALGAGNDYVYLAYSYDDADPADEVVARKIKIVLYSYDAAGDSLVDPIDLISGLHGSGDHNSGRLLFGPDRNLYYSIGDQGNNQYDNYCTPIEAQRLPTTIELAAQDWSAYQGKILRISLDGSIPDDNPMINGVRSHIWTYGHRNAQGLVFAADGTLYEAEHGPKSDDEVNILAPGDNYGWPDVAGYQDDQAYVYARWSESTEPPCEELEYSDFEIPPSVPVTLESEWSSLSFHPPEHTFYTVADDFDFQDEACAEGEMYYICWPTVAPSSLAVYEGYSDGIAGLDGSLLMTTLKLGTLFRIDLGASAGATEPEVLFHTVDRYRRVTVSPDGQTIYVATDVAGNTMDDDGTPTDVVTHPGAILALSVGGGQ